MSEIEVDQNADRAAGRQMNIPETPMSDQTILLRVEDGTWEGWGWMAWDEFLDKVSLDAWKVEQVMIGMVLPPDRHRMH